MRRLSNQSSYAPGANDLQQASFARSAPDPHGAAQHGRHDWQSGDLGEQQESGGSEIYQKKEYRCLLIGLELAFFFVFNFGHAWFDWCGPQSCEHTDFKMISQALRRTAQTPQPFQRYSIAQTRNLVTSGAYPSKILGVNYKKQIEVLDTLKRQLRRPLTLTEKLLYSHLIVDGERNWDLEKIDRGKTILELRPDRIACHDATATMALLQFISAGLPRVVTPTTVHCDHLIISEKGAKEDLQRATSEHAEVYDFLSSASRKYGIGFWKPGSGIIHTVIFENYGM